MVIIINALYSKQNNMVITLPSTEVCNQSQWCWLHNATFAAN